MEKYKIVLLWDGTEDKIDFLVEGHEKLFEVAKFLLDQGYEIKILHDGLEE